MDADDTDLTYVREDLWESPITDFTIRWRSRLPTGLMTVTAKDYFATLDIDPAAMELGL